MKSIKNLSFKENPKDIIIYIILMFLFVFCISLLIPSVKEHIHSWFVLHDRSGTSPMEGSPNSYPELPHSTW